VSDFWPGAIKGANCIAKTGFTVNKDLSKEALLARLRTTESKLVALEKSRNAAIKDHRVQASAKSPQGSATT
jgi:hypothetical protein